MEEVLKKETDLNAKRLAAAAALKQMGDETDGRKFTSLISEWQEELFSESNIYYRIYRETSNYFSRWLNWENEL